jgi:iron complex transport system substrate-binding protein
MIDILAVSGRVEMFTLCLGFVCALADLLNRPGCKGKTMLRSHLLPAGNRKLHHGVIICVPLLMLSLMTAPGSEARLVKDQSGREVLVPDDLRRVVSLAPSITEIVFALGEGGRLKGVTQHCDFPVEAQSLPRVGSYVHPDLERIVALGPDLCIATRDGNPRGLVEKLEALKIPVYVVNPRNLNTVMDTILEIGSLLNAGQRAQDLANDMRARIERVKSCVAKAGQCPRVFFQIGIVPIVSVGTNTFIHELITTAGGRNLAEGPTPYPRFSREQALALEPEVIIITSMTRGQVLEPVREEWNQWVSIPAVRSQRIFVVESNLFDRPTPRLVEGLEILARLIHPESF